MIQEKNVLKNKKMTNYKKIIFTSSVPGTKAEKNLIPAPSSQNIPEWFQKANRYAKDPSTDKYWLDENGGKYSTWKGCPVLADMLSTGYLLKTPCDIKFYLNKGDIDVEINDKDKKYFCTKRNPMYQFVHPNGYYETHFAWTPNWAIKLPEGYSALYTMPLNRFDLPFLMTTGIVDNDKISGSGSIPFFLVKGFEGTIPAGTPYAQIIPFKRENWESEIVIQGDEIIKENIMKNYELTRIKDGGYYRKNIWSKRTYK